MEIKNIKKILIVVDYQKDFASSKGALSVPQGDIISKNIQNRIDSGDYESIIYTFDTHTKSDYEKSKEKNVFGFPIHCEYKTKGWELFNIKPICSTSFEKEIENYDKPFEILEFSNNINGKQINEFFFTKNVFSIWEGNDSYPQWFENNFSKDEYEIEVVGLATNYCVFMNVIGMVNKGYKVSIIEDCVKGITHNIDGYIDESYEKNITVMKNKGVNFISYNEIEINDSNKSIIEDSKYIPLKGKKINQINSLDDLVKIVGKITTPSEELSQKVIDNIRKLIKDYIEKNKLKSLVLGVSGGLDSAIVAAICQEKYTGVPLIGISIPMSSSTEHREQAEWVGNTYCSVFEEFREWDNEYFPDGEAEAYNCPTNMINEICSTTSMTNKLAEKAGFKVNKFPTNILDGNIKARMRMITLYDLARKTNGMVLSTDNKSEYMMGFWTLLGDVGDYGPIQNIGKGFELPAIARTLNIREDIIEQNPSDGLMVTEDNTDEAQLGANYQEVDTIMTIYLNETISNKIDFQKEMKIIINEKKDGYEKIIKVIKRYHDFEYKRIGTINLTRDEIGI
jgi:nicotinamide-nucleotide amidase